MKITEKELKKIISEEVKKLEEVGFLKGLGQAFMRGYRGEKARQLGQASPDAAPPAKPPPPPANAFDDMDQNASPSSSQQKNPEEMWKQLEADVKKITDSGKYNERFGTPEKALEFFKQGFIKLANLPPGQLTPESGFMTALPTPVRHKAFQLITGKAAAAPAAAPAAPKTDGTSDIVLPHASLLKSVLTSQLGKVLSQQFADLSPEQRKALMTNAMGYINNLPNAASKVIAEGVGNINPEKPTDQKALAASLKAKHAANPAMINKKMQALEKQLNDYVKTQITPENIKDKLFYAIPKNMQNSKEALQYMKSLQKAPEKHIQAFYESASQVIKNIISTIQKSVSTQQPAAKLPESTLKENKQIFSETDARRFKVLSGLSK